MIRFTIPYPPTREGMTAWGKRYSLNAYWTGKHYRARNQDAREIHDLTAVCMRKAGIRRTLLDCPAEVRFYWDDGLDADNHAALGKMILDAMKGYILPDDNRKWVRRVSHEFWDGKEILVEVVPYDRLERLHRPDQREAGARSVSTAEEAGPRPVLHLREPAMPREVPDR